MNNRVGTANSSETISANDPGNLNSELKKWQINTRRIINLVGRLVMQ